MDDKKFQKAIDILLEQQSRFYSDLEESKHARKDSEKRINVLERVSLNLYNTSVEQGKNIDKLSDDIRELRDGQKETNEQLKETNERLNAVIFMAEKFFSGQNGGTKPNKKK